MSYYFNHHNNYHAGSQKNAQKNEQKIIQDQNFSNEIFFGILSTIESMMLHYQGRSNDYHSKMFKAYDRVNYSSKNINQLRSQLQSQIMLFQASRKVFLQENSNVGWQLPKKFDQKQSDNFLQNSLNAFNHYKDEVSYRLTEDVRKLLWDQLDGLYAEKANLKINYSEEEKKGHKKDMFINGMFAGEQMDKRQEEVKDCKNQHDLPAYFNQQNNPFNNSTNKTGSIKNQNSQQSTKGANKQQSNHHSENKEDKSAMDIQSPKQDPKQDQRQEKIEWSYLAFYRRQQAEKVLDKKMNYKTIFQSDCKFLQNWNEVIKYKQNLISNKLIHLVEVQMTKEKDVKKFSGEILNLNKIKQ